MADTEGARQATVAISQDQVVLFYQKNGRLYKRVFSYGSSSWDELESFVTGEYPDLVDRNGALWLVWSDSGIIYYTISFDGGHVFMSPSVLINSAIIPSITVLPNNFIGLACIT